MTKSNPTEEQLVGVGVIRKAHGVRGEASVEPLGDSVDRLTELNNAFLVSPDRHTVRPVAIDAARLNGPRALLHFKGIETPEALRELYNWSVEILEEHLPKLEGGAYYIHDLVDLEVVDSGGKQIGVTTDALEAGGGVLLTVKRPDGRTFEMPFAESICTEVDLNNRRVVADVPVGLMNLDEVTAVEDDGGPATVSLRIDIVTIFPRMFDAFLEEGVLARAAKARLLKIKVWDLRDFTRDKHRSTDDVPYGGGGGMVMLAEPVFQCFDKIRGEQSGDPWVIYTSPQGRRFGHAAAAALARRPWLIVICGRYEGIDDRVLEELVDEEISIGDFVVSGGEVPAMLMIDAVARLVEGVVGDWNSVRGDSFYNGLLDHPHYTRPADFRGMKVPEVLLSGHAERIRKWRREQALRATLEKRPDLLDTTELDDEAREILEKIRNESAG